MRGLLAAVACFIGVTQANVVIAGDFTAPQRAQIIQIVRETLKGDHSILREAIDALQSEQSARQAEAAGTAIKASHDALYGQPDPVAGNDKGDLTIEGTPTVVIGEHLVTGSDLADVQTADAAARAERRQNAAANRQ